MKQIIATINNKPFITCKICGGYESFILEKPMTAIEILQEFHKGWLVSNDGFICPNCKKTSQRSRRIIK